MFISEKQENILKVPFTGVIRMSYKELRRTSSLTGISLCIAINVVLGFYGTIYLTQSLKIGFSFLALAICGMLYGPVATGMAGAISDILKYIIRPSGPFFPGFTLSEFISGFLFGLFLYKKKVTVKRAILVRLVVVLVGNFLLTPLWLSMLYGKGFMFYMSERIVKNLIMFPIDTIMLYFTLKTGERIKKSI